MIDKNTASAFSPGHITGFFEICDTIPPAVLSGSRGAGVCLSLGAVSTVTVGQTKKQGLTITLNDAVSSAPVTQRAIHYLLGNEPPGISVAIKTHLPCSQGFGMSAAGTLATTLSLSHLMGMSREKAVESAHLAEIDMKTGLGDVVSSSMGGIVIRCEPGIKGNLKKIPGSYPLALGVLGKGIHTQNILTDPDYRKKICYYGSQSLDKLLGEPSFETFVHLSRNFSEKTGLMTPRIREVIHTLSPYGLSAMCMLGTSLFALGDLNKIIQVLSHYGPTYHCMVDLQGARLLSHQTPP